MKLTRLSLIGLGLVLTVALATADEGQTWFDLTNCAMCKNMAAEEGMIEAIDWESHKISNGMLTVMVVPEKWQAAYERSHKNMMAVVEKLEAGEQMHLCGFCTSYGKLMMSGANSEHFQGDHAIVALVTSNDPEVVEMIHVHADRTVEEYAKWSAEQEAAKGGHQ